MNIRRPGIWVGALIAMLASCATTFPPPADSGKGDALLVTRVNVYGTRFGGALRIASSGDISTGIAMNLYSGEPARIALRHVETRRVFEASRVVQGYAFFVNIPAGAYRLESARVGGDEPIPLSGQEVDLSAESGRARYAGTFRLDLGPTGAAVLEPAPGGEEEARRAEVREILAARGAGHWVLE